MTKNDEYLWDRSGPPDPEIVRLEEMLRPFGLKRFVQTGTGGGLWYNIVPLAAAAALVLGLGYLWQPSTPIRSPHWDVRAVAGSPVIGSRPIAGWDKLAIGEWLETDSASRAQLLVGDFGEIDVAPGTRLRLMEATTASQRLALETGHLEASIVAPPRLFVVETPSAKAVDLGCQYVLTVDEDGSGRLHVTAGWVALEFNGRESVVPAGAKCEMRRGQGPGTPYCENASEDFREALIRFDFSGEGNRWLPEVIAASGPCDMMALWHLLRRVGPQERLLVYDRMAQMDTPPESVTRAGVGRLDSPMLENWWQRIKIHRTCYMCGEMDLPLPRPAPDADPS